MMPLYPPVAGGGGSGITAVPMVTVRRTAGDITVSSTAGTWDAVDATGALDLVIAAATGDKLLLLGDWLSSKSGGNLVGYDIATIVSATATHWVSSAGGAAPLVEGIPGWYPQGSGGDYATPGAGPTYIVQAGDLTAGQITLRLYFQGAGSATIFANANTPLEWGVANLLH